MKQNYPKIYQAPLQGFTDFDFRRAVAETFGGVDKFFVPYLSYGKGREIKKSQVRDVSPDNNLGLPTVPQVLFADFDELHDLISILLDYGYPEINLNLGCPYPMVTNKGRGAALLQKTDALLEMLDRLYAKNYSAKFSVKMRTGMTDAREALAVFDILNRFPLEEVIFHPRTASQMYDGAANPDWFAAAVSVLKHKLVYNGDIVSSDNLSELKHLFPEQETWMVGRGLLMNPALAAQLKGEILDPKELRDKFRNFHDRLFEAYSSRLDGAGHIILKMNQFWSYFCEAFENPHKTMKLVKKSGSLAKYNAAVSEIFSKY